MSYQEVKIQTENGKQLFGWFIPASKTQSAPAIAVIHGWGSNAEMMLPLAKPFHEAGYAMLFFDSRNHGQSDSDAFSSLPRFAEDLEHALNWLAEQSNVDGTKLIAMGHSVGAGAALQVASHRHNLAAVVSISAFSHPKNMMRRILASKHIPYFPLGQLILRFVEFTIGHRFRDIAPCNTIQQINCPVLLVHGEDDRTVPVVEAHEIYAKRKSNHVRLLILKGDHDSSHQIIKHTAELVSFVDQAMRDLEKRRII
ncbi:alpha/beta hydrolase [Sulfurirhabdus autotrophica]|uniref:alpha/beta hydrolase n=1 Tax=Sulfurirhabdus autotrophica TaxID=1706046 RepID=UPI001CB8994A|nr:alpha/beta fold hydrolase [Sulfurirhabdus autotrophica]